MLHVPLLMEFLKTRPSKIKQKEKISAQLSTMVTIHPVYTIHIRLQILI